MSTWEQIYLGLGGNITNDLGDPASHIMAVADTLCDNEHFCDVQLSSLYASKPFGVVDQPDFINAVLSAKTDLSPLALLDVCQQLEKNAGRVKLRHWGERSLDVDVLFYGDQTIQNDRLTVPHAYLFERNFVLVPLAELNPCLTINGKKIADELWANDLSGLTKLA
ncbi:2-amino-4-hydroxy-6-hydroxymethyldihydropteridine diphosphokinase [Moraxella nasovis]|uniref:2-amino-4-hydroxy-6- hydroxymethyldihydropteridine diphosphokinase n=1 Tax=Moraxella nasovis TaxID=2904121 RepID=UPI001F61FDA0|nr:2-amino-4-hydroxy-6-hydroxymethyldihydropteridine diphosphokinase [Moraxella nasovis]UNU72527.1 2-amino-4-hydroxy-6-hydroxymethyldihydropteridine diphosphokinase [Moraxella nasovis]